MKRILLGALAALLCLGLPTPAFAAPHLRAGELELVPTASASFLTDKVGIWVNSSNSLPYFHLVGGTDVQVMTAGSATLAQVYANGSAGPQSITLDSTRLGLRLKDASVPLGVCLLCVTNNGASSSFLAVTASGVGATAFDASAAGALPVGAATATSVDLGGASIPTNVKGNLQLAAGKNLTASAGAGAVDLSLMSGTFKSGQGDVTLGDGKLVVTGSTGIVSTYHGEATAGVGQPYIEAVGQDVASSGAGAQSTTITTYTVPITGIGLYRVSIVFSATTDDTVTAQITYTDAVNATAQTLTPISAVTTGANGTTYGWAFVRPSNATAIVAKITNSSQVTTKASAVIERLN